jgi:hypothetical protein
VFPQAAAPAGWSIDTSVNDSALRIVNTAGGGKGGSAAFSGVFATRGVSGSVSVSGSVGNTTLNNSQMPSHSHASPSDAFVRTGAGTFNSAGSTCCLGFEYRTASEGGNGAHNHGWSGSATFTGAAMDFAVKYVDSILCVKN